MQTTTNAISFAAQLRMLAERAERVQSRSDLQQVARALNVMSLDILGQIKRTPSYALETRDYRNDFEAPFGL